MARMDRALKLSGAPADVPCGGARQGAADTIMGGLRLDDVRPGMILAREVRSPVDDRLLLAAGTGLTERHLTRLRLWGVVEVAIDGPGAPPAAAPRAADLAAAAAHVDALFRRTDRAHPVVAELARHAAVRRLDALARDGQARGA